MDNEQFQFGQSLRPQKGMFGNFVDGFKNFYLTKLKGYDIEKICVATIVMEGTSREVAIQDEKLTAIGLEMHGIPAGEHNGKRGYLLTFMIAYIRVSYHGSFLAKLTCRVTVFYQDVGLDYGMVAESFETSAPWDKVISVVNNTKSRLNKECTGKTN